MIHTQTSLFIKALRITLFVFLFEVLLHFGGWAGASFQNLQNKINMKDAKAVRVLCLGDSMTFYGGANSYPNQLQTILNENQSGATYEVYNHGIPKTRPVDIVKHLPAYIENYHPDIVALMVGIEVESGASLTCE